MANIAITGLVGRSMFFDVPRFHSGGETIHAKGFYEEWGGKGFNQAVAVARQGAKVSFLGAVGMDDVEPLSSFCEGEKVDCLLSSGLSPSARAAILTDGSGETRVTVFPGVTLSVADVECFRGRIEAADFLLLNNEVPEEVNLRASEIAVAKGVKIIFNPAPVRPLPAELVSRVSIFTPNEFEETALDEVSCEVVTTLGARGCRIRSTGEVIPVVPCGKPVDSTGAGDTFTAVLAVRLAEGMPLADACREANAAAAYSVTVRYVMPSLPRRGDF